MEKTWTDYISLAEGARQYFNGRHQHLERAFGIGHHDRFDVNLYDGVITFTSGGHPRVTAACRPAGSLSHISNTWLWAWANTNLPPTMRGLSKRARLIGKREGHPRLVEAKWPADEDDAWQVTSILLYLVKGEGAYRCPTDMGDYYVVFTEVSHVAG